MGVKFARLTTLTTRQNPGLMFLHDMKGSNEYLSFWRFVAPLSLLCIGGKGGLPREVKTMDWDGRSIVTWVVQLSEIISSLEGGKLVNLCLKVSSIARELGGNWVDKRKKLFLETLPHISWKKPGKRKKRGHGGLPVCQGAF